MIMPGLQLYHIMDNLYKKLHYSSIFVPNCLPKGSAFIRLLLSKLVIITFKICVEIIGFVEVQFLTVITNISLSNMAQEVLYLIVDNLIHIINKVYYNIGELRAFIYIFISIYKTCRPKVDLF